MPRFFIVLSLSVERLVICTTTSLIGHSIIGRKKTGGVRSQWVWFIIMANIHFFHQHYPGNRLGPNALGTRSKYRFNSLDRTSCCSYPDEHGTMFSGSAVVDENNTSGFFKNPDGTPSQTGGMVLIVTADVMVNV